MWNETALLKFIFIEEPKIFKWRYFNKISWLREAKKCHVKNSGFLFLEKGICVSKWFLWSICRKTFVCKGSEKRSLNFF